jgi:hypothetical protein
VKKLAKLVTSEARGSDAQSRNVKKSAKLVTSEARGSGAPEPEREEVSEIGDE